MTPDLNTIWLYCMWLVLIQWQALDYRLIFFLCQLLKLIRKDGDYHTSKLLDDKDMQANQNMQPKKKHKKSSNKVKEEPEVKVVFPVYFEKHFTVCRFTQIGQFCYVGSYMVLHIFFFCLFGFFLAFRSPSHRRWQFLKSSEELHLWPLLRGLQEQLPPQETHTHTYRWDLTTRSCPPRPFPPVTGYKSFNSANQSRSFLQ